MRLLLPLLAACLLAVFAAPAHAAWPSLAGTTTITGSQTGYAIVELDRPIEIDLWEGIPAEVTGGGRFVGAMLRSEADSGPSAFQASMLRGETPDQHEGDALWPSMTEEEFESDAETKTMPAGVYRLYVITAGAPVSVRLTLPLDGETTVAPQVPVRQTVRDLPRVDGAPGSNVATFGTSETLGSEGLWALRPRIDARAATRVDLELCLFGPGETERSYGPGCGDDERAVEERVVYEAENAVFSVVYAPFWLPSWLAYAAGEVAGGGNPYLPMGTANVPEDETRDFTYRHSSAEPGSWGLGGNVQIYGAPTSSVSMSGLWIDYEPAPGTPLPAEPADPQPSVPAAPPAQPAAAPVAAAPAVAPPATTKKAAAKKKAAKRCAKKAKGKKAKRRAACAKKKPAKRKAARRKGRGR